MALNVRKLLLAVAVLLATISRAEVDGKTDGWKWKFSWEDDADVEKAYGNLAVAFSKEYIEKHQSFFLQQLISEMKGFTLKDMHINHEKGEVDFATHMQAIKLLDIDLSKAGLKVDFLSDAPIYIKTQCESKFDVQIKLTDMSMLFGF